MINQSTIDNKATLLHDRSRLLLVTVLAWQVAFGSTIYSTSLGRLDMVAISVLISIVAYLVTDYFGWLKLHWGIANAAAILAAVYTMQSYQRTQVDTQLLTIADLLLFLQYILLFQEKFPRLIWQIIVLNFLQVLLGAALSLSAFYGAMLIPYFIGQIYLLILVNEDRHALAHMESLDTTQNKDSESAIRNNDLSTAQSSHSSASVHDNLLSKRFCLSWRPGNGGLIFSLLLWSITITAALFLGLPRFSKRAFSMSAVDSAATVGFDSTISLAGSGEILTDEEPVMRVEFVDQDDTPVQISGEPLFRGSVLNRYYRGKWSNVSWLRERGTNPLDFLPYSVKRYVVQKTIIQPTEKNILFHIYPVYSRDRNRHRYPVRFNEGEQHVYRHEERKQLQYEVITTGIKNGQQNPLVRDGASPSDRDAQQYRWLPSDKDLRDLNEWDGLPKRRENVAPIDDFQELEKTARKLIADENLTREKTPNYTYRVAKLFERYLRSSRFKYTLKREKRPDNIDPIVDYVLNNPQGHCEFSASALALMLRTVRIPSRVVLGYKGGIYNKLGNYYQVNQNHAHAWVEAYFKSSEIPEEMLPSNDITIVRKDDATKNPDDQFGYWLTLDPTANTEADSFAEEGFMARIADMGGYVQMLWNKYIIGLNSERQQKEIFEPLKEMSAATRDWLLDKSDNADTSWSLELVVKVVLRVSGFAIVVGFSIYSFLRWQRHRRRKIENDEAPPQEEKRYSLPRSLVGAEWWEKLVALAQSTGLRPETGQTPLEFATRFQSQLAASALTFPISDKPLRIVKQYYRDRFGQKPLESEEVKIVEQELQELAKNLQPESSTNGKVIHNS